jgi:hypothetical protein
VAWLEAAQGATGGWDTVNPIRDTALAVEALRRSQPASAALGPAQARLLNWPARSSGDQARIVAALAGKQTDLTALVTALQAAQNPALNDIGTVPTIFEDTFDNPAGSGVWTPSSAVNCRSEYTGGVLRVQAQNNAFGTDCWYFTSASFSDFDLEVEVGQVDAGVLQGAGKRYGLIFRHRRASEGSAYGLDDAYYRFAINPDTGAYALSSMQNRVETMLVDWTAAGAIRQGDARNLLRVVAQGTELQFYANGELLTAVNDATFTAGRIGLYVGSPDTNKAVAATFDNLVVYRTREFTVTGPNVPGGGWGTAPGYASDSLNTALALIALKSANASANPATALNYLIAAQNSDGGWSIVSGSPSDRTSTALAVQALAGYAGASGVQSALDRGKQYLLGGQNGNGSWDNSVVATALTVKTLHGLNVPPESLDAARSYLSNTQSANGSWNDRVYDTALALIALSNETPPVNGGDLYLPLITR